MKALESFEPRIAARGDAYIAQGRVGEISWDTDNEWLVTSVQGTRSYEVTWTWVANRWRHGCTCPYGPGCKHAYAAGHLAADQGLQIVNPAAWAESRGDVDKPVLDLTEKLETAIGRKLRKTETRHVRLVERLYLQFVRSGFLSEFELADFAERCGRLQRRVLISRDEFYVVFDEENPPSSSFEFWQCVAAFLGSFGWVPPKLFAGITDTTNVDAKLRRYRREREIARWTELLHGMQLATSNAAVAEHAVSRPVILRLKITPRKLVFQATNGDSGSDESLVFRDLRKAELQELNPYYGYSAAFETLDAKSALLLQLLGEQESSAAWGRRSKRGIDAEAGANLAVALLHPDLRERIVGENGEPLRRAEKRLVWELKGDTANAEDLRLCLCLADGEPAPEPLRHVGGPPHVYLSSDSVFHGPPPVRDDGDAGWEAAVPAVLLEQPGVVRALAASQVRLPQSVVERIVEVPLRARLRVWLSQDGRFGEEVNAVLLAEDTDGNPRLAWIPSGWSSDFELVHSPECKDTRMESLLTAPLAAAVEVFRKGPVSCDIDSVVWSRTVNNTTPADLSAWFGDFPDDTLFDLAPELVGLRDSPVRAGFSLQVEKSGRDWFDVKLVVDAKDTDLTPEEIGLLRQATGKWVRLTGKGWRRLALSVSEEQEEALQRLGLTANAEVTDKQRFHAMQLAAAAVGELVPKSTRTAIQKRSDAIRSVPMPPIPEPLTATLRPYQIEGFHFLAHLSTNGLGGILADDMGLGKTVMALAWFLWLSDRQPAGKALRILVVCPKSVVINWVREASRFAPGLGVVQYAPRSHQDLPDAHVIVANYAQLRLADDRFSKVDWTAVVLDEGQYIKNPRTRTAQMARDLVAEHRIVLTGTPIENRILDLWSLLAFAMPGLLGGQTQFKRLYNDKRDPEARHRLAQRVRHFVLRRTKGQVATDLPPRTEEDVLFDLEGEQAKLYQAELKRARQMVMGVASKRDFDAQRFNILQSLLRLRQICCHPKLVDHRAESRRSAKLDAMFEQLEPILAEGHKVLIFSQFVSMLEIIRSELAKRSIEHLIITGKTENRQELVDRFQGDPSIPVFLLSLKAAGSGLNLTAASYVVLYDPWWNPAVEAQAIDRTHRIGQESHVIAYRLIARGSVEEKIRQMQAEKATLARAVVQEESLATVLDIEALRFVLS